MEVEYGVKTANKFLISEFMGVDDDDVLDPSEILQKLLDNHLKETKTISGASKKKQAQQLAQQKKKVPIAIIPASEKSSDRSKPARSANNKENDVSNNAHESFGPTIPNRFQRGGMNQSGRGGAVRTRLPRMDRTDLPPRFRQGNENDQGFPQENNLDTSVEPDVDSRQEFGGGFKETDNAGGRPFNNRPNRGFAPRARLNNEFDGRGGRGNGFGGGVRPIRRQFDRQSGSDKTGVKSVDKRDGAGAHNWGSAADAVADQLSSMDASADLGKASEVNGTDMDVSAVNGAEDTEEKREETATKENVEQETVQLTLDEWRAQQMPKQQVKFNIRRAGEGDKNAAWEKLKPLKKADESSKKKNQKAPTEEDGEEEYEEETKIVPIDICFIGEQPRRGRGGGMRGRGGRGFGPSEFGMKRNAEQKESKKNEAPYKIDDETFPSLS